MFYIYLVLMSVIYGAYVWLFHYRMSMSEVWLSKSTLTPEDSAMISQLGKWSEMLDILFLPIFIGMGLFCFYKRRSDRKIVKKFIAVNAILALGVVVFSIIFNQITSLPFMNLVLPIINLVGIVILLTIWLIIEWLIKYRNIVSRA